MRRVGKWHSGPPSAASLSARRRRGDGGRRSGCRSFWEGISSARSSRPRASASRPRRLVELGALRSREGSTILGAAVIDDVMGIIVLSVVVAFAKASGGGVDVAEIGSSPSGLRASSRSGIYLGRWIDAGAALGQVARRERGRARAAWSLPPLLVGGGIPRWRGRDHRCVSGRRAFGADIVQEAVDAGIIRSPTRCSFPSSSSASACRPTAGHSAGARCSPWRWFSSRSSPRRSAAGCSRGCSVRHTESMRVGVGMISRGRSRADCRRLRAREHRSDRRCSRRR